MKQPFTALANDWPWTTDQWPQVMAEVEALAQQQAELGKTKESAGSSRFRGEAASVKRGEWATWQANGETVGL